MTKAHKIWYDEALVIELMQENKDLKARLATAAKLVSAANEDFCPYIHSCNGEQPDEYENPDVDSCPCAEWGAPCWYYKNVYVPLKVLAGETEMTGVKAP